MLGVDRATFIKVDGEFFWCYEIRKKSVSASPPPFLLIPLTTFMGALLRAVIMQTSKKPNLNHIDDFTKYFLYVSYRLEGDRKIFYDYESFYWWKSGKKGPESYTSPLGGIIRPEYRLRGKIIPECVKTIKFSVIYLINKSTVKGDGYDVSDFITSAYGVTNIGSKYSIVDIYKVEYGDVVLRTDQRVLTRYSVVIFDDKYEIRGEYSTGSFEMRKNGKTLPYILYHPDTEAGILVIGDCVKYFEVSGENIVCPKELY
mgnify:CR=1 FL=1